MSGIRTAAALVGLVLSGLALQQLFAAGPTTQKSTVAGPATQPATHIVKKGALSLDVSLDGVFQPADAFEVRFKMKNYSGPLTVLKSAAPFANVKKGDTLIECDPQNMKWMLTGVENELNNSRASLKKAEFDAEFGTKADALALRIQQDAVKNAESAVAWWQKVDGPQMLQSLELSARQAKFNIEDQEDELDQLKKMYGAEELNKPTADIVLKRALRRLELSKISIKMQEDRAEKTKTNEYPNSKQRVLDALEQVKNALASLETSQAQQAVVRQSTLSNARVALQQAEQKASDLKADAAALVVAAPFDGTVVYGTVENNIWQGGDPKTLRPGERLAAGGNVVMRVTHPGQLQIELSVPENRAMWIEPGAKAKITPTALPQITYEAACGPVTVAPHSNPPGFTFSLIVAIPSADPRLLPGMKASVKIEGKRGQEALLIPLSAVSGGSVTLKAKDGQTEKRTVTLGRTDGQSVEVLTGLAEGDEILLSGTK